MADNAAYEKVIADYLAALPTPITKGFSIERHEGKRPLLIWSGCLLVPTLAKELYRGFLYDLVADAARRNLNPGLLTHGVLQEAFAWKMQSCGYHVAGLDESGQRLLATPLDDAVASLFAYYNLKRASM